MSVYPKKFIKSPRVLIKLYDIALRQHMHMHNMVKQFQKKSVMIKLDLDNMRKKTESSDLVFKLFPQHT